MSDEQKNNDIFANLPKKSAAPDPNIIQPTVDDAPPPAEAKKSLWKGTKKEKKPKAPKETKPAPTPEEKADRKEKGLRALWTIASTISMVVNVVVVLVLLFVVASYRKKNDNALTLPDGIDNEVVLDLLQGLHENFVKMDAAHIKTDILVQDTIPVQFDLDLNQQTVVTLSEAVTIYGASVYIDTALIDLNAPATVVLPAGTKLPIELNLTVPVDTIIPVTLNVPVDIPLADTELHDPFAGLQDVVTPLYCLIDPQAKKENGEEICLEKKTIVEVLRPEATE